MDDGAAQYVARTPLYKRVSAAESATDKIALNAAATTS